VTLTTWATLCALLALVTLRTWLTLAGLALYPTLRLRKKHLARELQLTSFLILCDELNIDHITLLEACLLHSLETLVVDL
jgi:hypothetical protein